MAARRTNPLRDSDIVGLKYFDRLMPLLERLHDVGTRRDRAGNRQLFFDHYCAYLLLFLFNPVVTSLRGIQQASGLKKVQKKLGCPRASLGSLSEAVAVFDPEPVKQIASELAGQLQPLDTDRQFPEVKHLITVVDGTLVKTLARIVQAAYLRSPTDGRSMSAWRLPAVDLPLAVDLHHRRHVRPGRRQPRRVVEDRHPPLLVPPVAVPDRLVMVPPRPGEVGRAGRVDRRLDRRRQRRLVAFHGQQVVALLRPDGVGDLDLTAGRVDRHQRALQLQDGQQFRDGGDFVRPVGHRLLAQDQVVLPGPRGDQVQAAAERLAGGRPHRLAVDRHRPQQGLPIRAFLRRNRRLRLERLPAYAPELNPVEAAWSWLKYSRLANFVPADVEDLDGWVTDDLVDLRYSGALLTNLWQGSELPFSRTPA